MKLTKFGLLWVIIVCLVTPSQAEMKQFQKRLTTWRDRRRRSTGNSRQGLPRSAANFTDALTPIRVAVILPTEKPFLFRRELVQPAIEYAIESIENEIAEVGYKFEVVYRDSFCSRRAALAAVDLYYGDDQMYERSVKLPRQKDDKDSDYFLTDMSDAYENSNHNRQRRSAKRTTLSESVKQKESRRTANSMKPRDRNLPMVFLGPACNEATSIVATFAESWNVPLITSGAPAGWITPGPEYPTLTRMSSNYIDFARFLASVFRHLKYGIRVPIHLVYEEVFKGPTTERECYYVMQSMYSVLNRNHEMQLFDPIYIMGSDFDEVQIIGQIGDPKVVLMCASSDIVRKVMIGAHKTGYADPSKNVWFAIDLHNSSHYASEAWKRNDENDAIAKEAFRSLQVITLYASQSMRFNNFIWKMNAKYKEAGISTAHNQVSEFAEGFHDAVLLYGHALLSTLYQGKNIRDGLAISNNMRNVSINGIAGPVVMSSSGDRYGDYSILAMDDYSAGTFSSVYDYLGSFEWVRNHGLPKLNLSQEPRTRNYTVKTNGVDVDAILTESEKMHRLAASTTQHEILAGILGTFGGMLLCCMLIFGPMCYHRKRRSRATISENGNGVGQFLNGHSDQVCLHRPLREEGSVTTCTTTLDDEQKL